MTQVITNRDAPTFGTSGASAQIVLPLEANYTCGVGVIDGAPAGWTGVLDWGFHFEAVLTPA